MSTVRVLETVHLGTVSGPVMLVGGQELDSSDPLVKAHPTLFTEPEPEPEPVPVVRAPRKATAPSS